MSWQEELRNGIRTADQLAQALGLTPEETARYAEIIQICLLAYKGEIGRNLSNGGRFPGKGKTEENERKQRNIKLTALEVLWPPAERHPALY